MSLDIVAEAAQSSQLSLSSSALRDPIARYCAARKQIEAAEREAEAAKKRQDAAEEIRAAAMKEIEALRIEHPISQQDFDILIKEIAVWIEEGCELASSYTTSALLIQAQQADNAQALVTVVNFVQPDFALHGEPARFFFYRKYTILKAYLAAERPQEFNLRYW